MVTMLVTPFRVLATLLIMAHEPPSILEPGENGAPFLVYVGFARILKKG